MHFPQGCIIFPFFFSFLVFTVCASVWFTRVDKSRVIQMLRPPGCEGGKRCWLCAWHQRLDVNLLRSTLQLVGTALPMVSVLGVQPSDRKNFALALSETVRLSLPFFPSLTHTLKDPFSVVFLSVVSSPVWKYIWQLLFLSLQLVVLFMFGFSSAGTKILTILLLETEPSVDFGVRILFCFYLVNLYFLVLNEGLTFLDLIWGTEEQSLS